MAGTEMNEHEIAEMVGASIEALYDEELDLLRIDAGERAICAQLRAILQRSFPAHRVHAEYNRHGILPKEIEMPDAEGVPTLTRVFPDIIVHEPYHDDENLLVIEAKKSTNPIGDDADLAKLTQMKHQLGYEFAAFIRLSSGPKADLGNVQVLWV